jgi:hypothetical protein
MRNGSGVKIEVNNEGLAPVAVILKKLRDLIHVFDLSKTNCGPERWRPAQIAGSGVHVQELPGNAGLDQVARHHAALLAF